ncbi:MAG: hypothetical protein HYZ48_03625 [Chlamydiales bacterium]|nr:hypothetical protein [Chlamydiales bacterium]
MDNNQKQMLSQIAALETKNDLLEAELMYLNEMLARCGFPEGIKTLKETVEELLAEDPSFSHERPELI